MDENKIKNIVKFDNCMCINSNGRDLFFLQDNSIDCIITDHPWDSPMNRGGNRHFAEYECFTYTIEDFREKYRVLKNGCFLVENIPEENASNYEYLYQIKKMATDAGFEYYSKVPWIKGNFVSNTGRKAKNSEDLMIFTKGKARALKIDVKKTKTSGETHYMSGTNGMLPTCINVPPVSKADIIAQSEKPYKLYEELIPYITLENEVILDQFAGSGSVAEACINTNRRCMLVESNEDLFNKIVNRINNALIKNNQETN